MKNIMTALVLVGLSCGAFAGEIDTQKNVVDNSKPVLNSTPAGNDYSKNLDQVRTGAVKQDRSNNAAVSSKRTHSTSAR